MSDANIRGLRGDPAKQLVEMMRHGRISRDLVLAAAIAGDPVAKLAIPENTLDLAAAESVTKQRLVAYVLLELLLRHPNTARSALKLIWEEIKSKGFNQTFYKMHFNAEFRTVQQENNANWSLIGGMMELEGWLNGLSDEPLNASSLQDLLTGLHAINDTYYREDSILNTNADSFIEFIQALQFYVGGNLQNAAIHLRTALGRSIHLDLMDAENFELAAMRQRHGEALSASNVLQITLAQIALSVFKTYRPNPGSITTALRGAYATPTQTRVAQRNQNLLGGLWQAYHATDDQEARSIINSRLRALALDPQTALQTPGDYANILSEEVNMARRNPWPKGKSRKRYNAGKKAARTRARKSRRRSLAAKKGWRKRRRAGK